MSKTPTLKFKREYKKLRDKIGLIVNKAKLLMVLTVPMDDMKDLKDFWIYEFDEHKNDLGFSEFYTVLILQKPDGNIFTAVRPSHSRLGSTAEYYAKYIGETLNVEIKENYY